MDAGKPCSCFYVPPLSAFCPLSFAVCSSPIYALAFFCCRSIMLMQIEAMGMTGWVHSSYVKNATFIGLSSPKHLQHSRVAGETTSSDIGSHIKSVASGIGKAGADLLHAAHSAASGAMSAVKDFGGFSFGNDHGAQRGASSSTSASKSYDAERGERARVWAETHRLVSQGSYVNRAGEHLQLAAMRGRPFKFSGSAVGVAAPSHAGCRTKIIVENKDCLHAAQQRVARGLRTCVLDAGSGGHFGGGYQRGASAQEEDICRRSCLAEMVDHELDSSLPQLYPLRTSCVMVPQVPVFRDDRHASVPYAFLDAPFDVDVGIVAGINRPHLVKQGGELRLAPNDVAHTLACIRNLFGAAQQVKAQALVLVPLGCGAFCNPPGHICDIFLQVINEFDGVFQVNRLNMCSISRSSGSTPSHVN
jgi:uncharacterized protein (TIGR02452 family)